MAQFGKERGGARARSSRSGSGSSTASPATPRPGRPAPAGCAARRSPTACSGRPWDASLVTLVAIATGAILFDGLSQTQAYFDLFAIPDLGTTTLLLAGFLGIVVALTLLVGRRVGMTAMGAGLLPISVGYLIAHYLTYLLGDGQRIVIAVTDPLQLGWDLIGTAYYEPSMAWLPASLVWTIMFGAVVGGHVLGAWAGHLRSPAAASEPHSRRAQLPLAVVMVGLTTLTLWSLGQAVFRPASTASTTAPGGAFPAIVGLPTVRQLTPVIP